MPHMHDLESHVKALEEDLEYYRTKRLEPRIFRYVRIGAVTLADLLRAERTVRMTSTPSQTTKGDLESRVRALEDKLDDYVRGIGLLSSDLVKGVDVVIEDGRKERGDYDDFFRIKKKDHVGSLEDRISRLEEDIEDYMMLLEVFAGVLISKGLLNERDLVSRLESIRSPSPWNGARIVARAWVDPDFKAQLMAKGREAVRELGIPPGRLGKLGVVENTESVHNVVVCTLCSCYPYDLLGDTPWWYKHDSYKTSIVANPRSTLEEMFGLKIPLQMELRVHDSTSDVRYMVLPRRPAKTEGISEEELAKLVTVESLIGVAEPLQPSEPRAIAPTQKIRTYS